tara:strand:+ start:212 stop:1030 length:819 start_codon:yes stop_codon:yes gene_type:complete
VDKLKYGLFPPEEISNEEYHGGVAVGSSQLKTLNSQTPMHLKGAERTESNTLKRGTAVHTALLEPELYEKTTARGPATRRGNAWKDAEAAAAAEGKTLLTEEEYDNALRVRDAVQAQPHIASLLQKNDRQCEFSAYANVDGVHQRVRPDIVLPGDQIMIDPKTSADGSLSGFTKSVFNYSYHIQAAMYPYIWEAAGGCKIKQFLFLAIETKAPYCVSLFELDHEAFEQGWLAYQAAVTLYKECSDKNEWPGYPTEIQMIEMPRWLNRKTGEE